jgi:hypothetical protein
VKYTDLLVAKMAEKDRQIKNLEHKIFELEDAISRIEDYIRNQ